MKPVPTVQDVPSRWTSAIPAGAAVVLSALFYLYVLAGLDPRLLYHQQCPVFMTGVDFLKEFVDRPAGLAEYVSLLLSQSCYYPWLGALVITGLTFLICMSTRRLLRSTGGNDVPPWLYYFPAVLLLMLENQYGFHLITSVALLGALVFTGVYVRMRRPGAWVRLLVFGVSAGVLYYLVGAMVVLFGVLCGIFELSKRRAVVLGVSCMVIASVLPIGFATYSCEVGYVEAYAPLLPWCAGVVDRFSAMVTLPEWGGRGFLVLEDWFRWALMLFFPVVMVVSGWRGRLAALRARRRGAGTSGTSGEAGATGGRADWTLLSFAVFLVLAILLTLLSFNDTRKKRLLIDYCAQEKMWSEVLRTARSLRPELHDAFVMCEVNRALFHTGRLPYEMFTYPQRIDVDSLYLAGPVSMAFHQTLLKSGTVFFELGHVNFAQKSCHTALEAFGRRPEILKRLIRINVLKNRPGVARALLNLLGRNPLYRSWAADFRRRLDADATLASDDEIRHVRSLMVTAGHGFPEVMIGAHTPDNLFTQLLAENHTNRMAFEYLMAYFLLTRQTGRVVRELGRLDDFDYTDIPRHCEEAVLVHQGNHPGEILDLHGRRVSDGARVQLMAFSRCYMPYQKAQGPDRKAAFEKLLREHGGHYFFYFRFRFSVAETRPFRPEAVTGASP